MHRRSALSPSGGTLESATILQRSIGNYATLLRVLQKRQEQAASSNSPLQLAGVSPLIVPPIAAQPRSTMISTSQQVIELLTRPVAGWAMTAKEQRETLKQLGRTILTLLGEDQDLSTTISELNTAGMLKRLFARLEEPQNRRDLLRLLGARLNPAARTLVEPIIQDLDATAGLPFPAPEHVHGAQIQYNLSRLGVKFDRPPFDRAAYDDLISSGALMPFTGTGATGIKASDRTLFELARLGITLFSKQLSTGAQTGDYIGWITNEQFKALFKLIVALKPQQRLDLADRLEYEPIVPLTLLQRRRMAAILRHITTEDYRLVLEPFFFASAPDLLASPSSLTYPWQYLSHLAGRPRKREEHNSYPPELNDFMQYWIRTRTFEDLQPLTNLLLSEVNRLRQYPPTVFNPKRLLIFEERRQALVQAAEILAHPRKDGLTAQQRRRQAELLLLQPISTINESSYAGQLPSRLEVIRVAARMHRLEPELVAAIILMEQRQQSPAEDKRDLVAGSFGLNTSIGAGQVLPSTARADDLLVDLITDHATFFGHLTARGQLSHRQLVWLLSSDEINIFATARYIRLLADAGARLSIERLPRVRVIYGDLDLSVYAGHSATWSDEHIAVIGKNYTEAPWNDQRGNYDWGFHVWEALRSVREANLPETP